ncbi:MAG: SCO6880 family protein [Pseudonocardiaceae bacterium]
MAERSAAPTVRTYGQWRLPKGAGLLGLGTAGTGILFAGIIAVLIGVLISLRVGLGVAVVVVAVMAPLVVRVGGRTGAQAVAARLAWWFGRRAGQHVYRSGPLSLVPGGTARLPGLLAPSVMLGAQDAYGRDFGLIKVPWSRHYTAVLRCNADGAALVDTAQIDTWVANWGGWLAALAHDPGVAGVSVTIDTAPDSGQRLRGEVTRLIQPGAPALAARVLGEAAASYPAGSAQVSTRVAITWGPTMVAGHREDTDVTVEIGHRLPALAEGLARTGAGAAVPMSAQAIAEMVRVAYDPMCGRDVDAVHEAGDTGISWDDAGPVAAQEFWACLRHDSGLSVTWAMEEAPRGAVLSGVLTQLLSPHPRLLRKRVTLIYRPHSPGDAARIVDADVRDATFNATKNPRATARATADLRAAEQSAGEEASGSGVVRFALLLTVTVPDSAALAEAEPVVRTLAATARIRLRRAYGGQSAAFAASLGVGVLLPHHASFGSLLTG